MLRTYVSLDENQLTILQDSVSAKKHKVLEDIATYPASRDDAAVHEAVCCGQLHEYTDLYDILTAAQAVISKNRKVLDADTD